MNFKISVFIFCMACIPRLFGQIDQTGLILSAKEKTLSFENSSYYENFKLPFGNVQIFDKRYDSSKLGYTRDVLGSTYHRLKLKNSWSKTVNDYFSGNLTGESPLSLIIIVQSFWLQPGFGSDKKPDKDKNKINDGMSRGGGTCRVELDIFIQSDTLFQPLFRINSSFETLAAFTRGNMDDHFFLPFDSIARRINNISIDKELKDRRKLKWDDIENQYDERFMMPVLKGSNPVKGVFLEFNDFKENKPFASEFRIKKARRSDELYIVKNGSEEILPKYWGFFDGTDLYIRIGMNVYKAVRQQNTFELMYQQKIDESYELYPRDKSMLENAVDLNLSFRILQLNMRSGDFY